MKIRVAISKRRAKRLAAGAIIYLRSLRQWEVFLYTVHDEMVFPFGSSPFETLEEALADGCETLKVCAKDWVKIEESEIEEYILQNTKNKWYPSKYKSVIKAEREIQRHKRRSKPGRKARS